VSLRGRLREILRGHTDPAEIGVAVAVGVFIGCLPLYGLHVALAVAAARVFRLNYAVVFLASNISNPLAAPLLIAGEVLVGGWLRGEVPGALPRSPWELLRAAPDAFATWLLGSVVVGATLGGTLGTFAYASARHVRRAGSPLVPWLAWVVASVLLVDGLALARAVPTGAAGAAGAVGLLATIGALVAASSRPELAWFGPTLVRARHPTRVAITLDDGPDPASTPRLLQALAAHRARATFFVLIDHVEAWPALFRSILDAGHEVGLHGRSHHPWLTVWSPSRGAQELRAGAATLEALGAPPVRWFRPPFGATSPRLYEAARQAGLEVAWCSVRTWDGGPSRPAAVLARCRRARGGDIVLLHEGDRPAATLLAPILAELGTRGLTSSTLSAALEVE
jgi:peptidoglycan/xylan/chitin deacetylase (PgdA/CDA1 family)/uncharacterized protein (DUF2062 family)